MKKHQLWLCPLAIAAIVALDQWVKAYIVTHFAVGESAEFLPQLLRLHYVRNFGAAWSSFSGERWLLIGVTGVGTKAALAILSAVSPDQLTLAVMTQDDKTITMAQGVGKKLAQRIILELKDKLGASQLELNTAQMAASGAPVRGSKTAEATAALVGLGYSQTEAAAALKGLDVENLSIEDIIRQALRAAARQ